MAERIQLKNGVKLSRDISGGIGKFKKGEILHELSTSAYNTLIGGGLGEPIKETTKVEDAIDVRIHRVSPVSDAAAAAQAKPGASTDGKN